MTSGDRACRASSRALLSCCCSSWVRWIRNSDGTNVFVFFQFLFDNFITIHIFDNGRLQSSRQRPWNLFLTPRTDFIKSVNKKPPISQWHSMAYLWPMCPSMDVSHWDTMWHYDNKYCEKVPKIKKCANRKKTYTQIDTMWHLLYLLTRCDTFKRQWQQSIPTKGNLYCRPKAQKGNHE
jgi:hypothetical protein